jgi:hypothetical protein
MARRQGVGPPWLILLVASVGRGDAGRLQQRFAFRLPNAVAKAALRVDGVVPLFEHEAPQHGRRHPRPLVHIASALAATGSTGAGFATNTTALQDGGGIDDAYRHKL